MAHFDTKAESPIGENRHTIDLAIVIPTFNERQNVQVLLARVETALGGHRLVGDLCG
jgi:hypothetical protein